MRAISWPAISDPQNWRNSVLYFWREETSHHQISVEKCFIAVSQRFLPRPESQLNLWKPVSPHYVPARYLMLHLNYAKRIFPLHFFPGGPAIVRETMAGPKGEPTTWRHVNTWRFQKALTPIYTDLQCLSFVDSWKHSLVAPFSPDPWPSFVPLIQLLLLLPPSLPTLPSFSALIVGSRPSATRPCSEKFSKNTEENIPLMKGEEKRGECQLRRRIPTSSP